MDYAAIETWLRTTIPGIVLSGAAGGFLAIVLWKLGGRIAVKFVPNPLKWHGKRQSRQAYFLGYAASHMEEDETGKNTIAFFAFHISLLLIALVFTTLCFMAFVTITQSQVSLTYGSSVSGTLLFIGFYWVYFEFKNIYKTYQFFWGNSMEHAAASYSEIRKRKGRREKGSSAGE